MLSTKNDRQGYFYLDKAYTLWIDQEENEQKKYIKKAILFHESRKDKRVKHWRWSCSHFNSTSVLGTKQRLFREDAKLNNVYNWVEHLSPESMYFKFSPGGSALIPASASASNFGLITLNMTSTLTFTIWVVFKKKLFSTCTRAEGNKKWVTNYVITPYIVEWYNVFTDFLKIYIANEDITSIMLSIRFLVKEAFAEGITRDVNSQFFKYIFRFKSASQACPV